MVEENIPSDAMPVGLKAFYAKQDAEDRESRRRLGALAAPPRDVRSLANNGAAIERTAPHQDDPASRDR